MKILKIFGVVVAVHAAAFMFVFAIPGCRSTTRPAQPQTGGGASSSDATVSYPGGPVSPGSEGGNSSFGQGDLNPGVAGGESVVSFNSTPGEASSRYNPTRPNTAAANVLQSGRVGDVRPATAYTVVSNDSLWKVAKKHGITVNELATANNLKQSAPLKVGQRLIIPGKAPAVGTSRSPGDGSGETLTYRVRAGETLGAIAQKSGTTVATLRALNPTVKNDLVRAGQDLIVPATPSAGRTAPAADSPVYASGTRPAAGAKHMVMPGESLGQIAKRYNVPLRDIAAANNIANPASLRAGQELIIPGARASAEPAAPAPVPIEAGPIGAPIEEAPIAPAPAQDTGPVAPPSDSPPVLPVEESGPIAPGTP